MADTYPEKHNKTNNQVTRKIMRVASHNCSVLGLQPDFPLETTVTLNSSDAPMESFQSPNPSTPGMVSAFVH